MTSLFSLPKLISQRARCTFCLPAAIMSLSITQERRCSPKKKAISSEDGSESWLNDSPPFICFPSPSIPLGITVIAASRYRVQLDTLILGYRQNTFYFLMAQIDLDASEFSFEQVKEHSKEIQSAIWLFFPPPPSLCKGAARRFNSQENQLKAGTGLTYTQWSKIDQRHPA